MTGVIDDKRQDNRTPLAYIVATDEAMSGWGMASGRSLFAVPCYSEHEIQAVRLAMKNRRDMKRARLVVSMKADGSPKVKMERGDHLSVRDPREAREFYRGAAAFQG